MALLPISTVIFLPMAKDTMGSGVDNDIVKW